MIIRNMIIQKGVIMLQNNEDDKEVINLVRSALKNRIF